MEITYTKKKSKAEPRIQGVETITLFDEEKEEKRPLLQLGYLAYSIIDQENDFLFDFGANWKPRKSPKTALKYVNFTLSFLKTFPDKAEKT